MASINADDDATMKFEAVAADKSAEIVLSMIEMI